MAEHEGGRLRFHLVAVRRYEWADGSGTVEARVYAPRRRGRDFSCLVEISGIGRVVLKHELLGGDSLQALRLGVDGVRYFLAPIAKDLRWLDGSTWLDLPGIVPAIFGDERDDRFQRAIDAEMDEISRAHGDEPDASRKKERDELARRRRQLLALRKNARLR